MINGEAPVPAAWARLVSPLRVKVAPYRRGEAMIATHRYVNAFQPGGRHIVRVYTQGLLALFDTVSSSGFSTGGASGDTSSCHSNVFG